MKHPFIFLTVINRLWGLLDEYIGQHIIGSVMPFEDMKAENICNTFRYYTAKLYKEGRIKAIYSIHDLRHFFATEYYKRAKDIKGLQVMLNHSSVTSTEKYLSSLGIKLKFALKDNPDFMERMTRQRLETPVRKKPVKGMGKSKSKSKSKSNSYNNTKTIL